MAPPPTERPAADVYEFGPFELDVASRGLYRSGEFVALAPKAFETLLVLVQDAGRAVTKEQLLERVWPGTFVEEGSITNNISTLRKILNPHFEGGDPITTVARRGYRFSAAVRLRSVGAEISLGSEAPVPVPPGFTTRERGIAIAALLVVAVIGGGLALEFTRGSHTPTKGAGSRRSIAVLPMKNLSGRAEYAWFSTALTETIAGELGAGGQLRLISGENVAAMQQDLAPPPGVGLSRKQLNEIGRTLGCDLILTGNYHLSSGRLRVDVRLDDIASAQPIASLSVEEHENKLLDLVAAASRELRAKLGISPALLGQSDAVRAGLSSNPSALQFYFLGLEALRSHDAVRSRELLTQAIAEDQDFALAHSALSSAYRIMGYDLRAREAATRAFELSTRLAREDQLLVEGTYYEVTANWPKAIEKYQALWNFFPDNLAYGVRLMYQLMKGGQLDEAQRVLAQMRALPPPADSDPGINLVATLLAARRGNFADALAEASGMAAKATARKANNQLAAARSLQGNAALQLGNPDQARRYYADARQIYERLGDSGGVAATMNMDAMVLISRDQLDEAERLLNTANEIVTRIKYQRLAAEVRFTRSNLARQQGHFATARAEADAAIAAARAVDDRSHAARGLNLRGSVLTLQGDYQEARASFDESATLARGIGEKAVFTAAVDGLAGVDLAQGHVSDARQRLEEIIPVDRKTGDKSALALRLANLSAALGMQGHLAEAEKIAAEECAIHESLAARKALAACRVRLAELWWGEGRAGDARAAIDRMATERRAVSLPPIDLARLADLYLSTGDAKSAASTIAEARRVVEGRASIPEQAIAIAITAARIDAASGQVADARRRLVQARSEAERLGLLPLALEARLAMAERGAPLGARAEAAGIERDADHAGLGLIAGKALAINRSRSVAAAVLTTDTPRSAR
jgi:DNA-binding winged helix-turn-helix (wHTH) protein/TolB-like protein/predicted negative regulator of RcsB-dependent stress response